MRTVAALASLAIAAQAGWIPYGDGSWSDAPAEWTARPSFFRSYHPTGTASSAANNASTTLVSASSSAKGSASSSSSAAKVSSSSATAAPSTATSATSARSISSGTSTRSASSVSSVSSARSSSATSATSVRSSSTTSSSSAAAATPSVPAAYLSGFKNATVGYSVGGSAICIQGDVDVAVDTASALKLNFPIPANQTIVTETFVEYLQINSQLLANVVQGNTTINSTFSINAQLCYPKDKAINATFVELLTHGIGFDKTYWNFYSSEYSYVDAAALAGHATFLYDRLGVGLSAHPDPIADVQAPVEVAIAHSLTQSLRAGTYASTKFAKVAGVGHSFGSIITVAQCNLWPTDLAAAILTGYTTHFDGIPTFMSALDAEIARQNEPTKFPNLNNGYIIANGIIANQFDFFRWPGFDPVVLAAANAARQTLTFGELFSLGAVPGTAPNFTGPVDVVDGDADWPFCQGNCTYPTDLAAAAIAPVFPKASAGSRSYIAPVTGHGLNQHYSAPGSYAHINSFLAANGF